VSHAFYSDCACFPRVKNCVKMHTELSFLGQKSFISGEKPNPNYHTHPVDAYGASPPRHSNPKYATGFNSTIHRAQLPLQIYGCVQLNSVLFYSVRRRRQCWSSQTRSLMRGGQCDKLHRPPLQLLFVLQQSSIDSQLFVEKRDFAYPTCIRRPRYGGPRRNIAMTFGIEILEWRSYQKVKFF